MRPGRQPNSLAIWSSVFPLAKRLNNFFSCGDSFLRSGDGICSCKLVLRSALTATVGKLLTSPEGINVTQRRAATHTRADYRGQRQVVLFARRLALPAAVMTLARSTW